MTENEIKGHLWNFTKAEIVEMFPSLKLDKNANKEIVINSVMDGSPTDEEKEQFKKSVEEKEIDEKPEKKKGPPSPVKKPVSEKSANPEKAGKYIVVSDIKEDGKRFKAGDDYTGRWAKRFIGEQIKKKD